MLRQPNQCFRTVPSNYSVCECSKIHTKGTSLPEAGINSGFSNSNYNRRAETSSGMSVQYGGSLGEAFTLTERPSWDREASLWPYLE